MTIRIFSDTDKFEQAGLDRDCIFPPLHTGTAMKRSGPSVPKLALDVLQDGGVLSCRLMTKSTDDPAWGALATALENALLEMRRLAPGQPGSVVIAIPHSAPGEGSA